LTKSKKRARRARAERPRACRAARRGRAIPGLGARNLNGDKRARRGVAARTRKSAFCQRGLLQLLTAVKKRRCAGGRGRARSEQRVRGVVPYEPRHRASAFGRRVHPFACHTCTKSARAVAVLRRLPPAAPAAPPALSNPLAGHLVRCRVRPRAQPPTEAAGAPRAARACQDAHAMCDQDRRR
jgi:hypothetical protein